MAPQKVAAGASESKNVLFLNGLVTSSEVYPDAGESGTDQNRPTTTRRWLKLFYWLGVCLLQIDRQPSPPSSFPRFVFPSSHCGKPKGMHLVLEGENSPRARAWVHIWLSSH